MEFSKFVDWAFLGAISGGIGWMVLFLGKLTKSINSLNQKIAVVIEQQSWHQRELERHDNRLQSLEGRLKHK